MEKLYCATIDTGRDFVSFEYFSEYRNKSKNNIIDCVDQYKSKHGRNKKINIINTWKI